MIEQVRKLCLLGATNEELANFFGVTRRTLQRWISEGGEFCHAVKEGRQIADANVGSRLYERAMGYMHDSEEIKVIEGEVVRVPIVKQYPPDTAAAFIWLKNRRPDLWRDAKQIEAHVNTQPLSHKEELQRAQQALAGVSLDEGEEGGDGSANPA